eukprot:Gb_25270 [translate_table: standard]
MGRSGAKWLKGILFGKLSTTCSEEKVPGKDKRSEKSKRASKGNRRWSFRTRTVQDRVLTTTAVSEPSNLNTEKEQSAVPQEWSMQTKSASTEKIIGSTLVDSTAAMTTEGMGKLVESVATDSVHCCYDVDGSREEYAVIKIQAAFRGYLARTAFSALNGLVRLQALIRGHLVRRQAVGALKCVQAIVKLQALARARRVRMSKQGLAVQEKLEQWRRQKVSKGNEMVMVSGIKKEIKNSKVSPNHVSFSPEILANVFARQLLESAPAANFIHIDLYPDKTNSGWSWLERWVSARPWRSGLPLQTGSRCLNTSEDGQVSEVEAQKLMHRLRKGSNSTLEFASDLPDVEAEKPKCSMRNVSNSTLNSVSDKLRMQSTIVGSLNTASDAPFLQSVQSQFSSDRSSERYEVVPVLQDTSPAQLSTASSSESSRRDNEPVQDGMVSSAGSGGPIPTKHDKVGLTKESEPELSASDQNVAKRRSSFGSVKSDHAEDGSHGNPLVPHYMASTESAKAKARGHSSPRFSPDVQEKNSVTKRRFSLPVSNGKQNSVSPRIQSPVQTTTKGNEKVFQKEWRR